MGSGQPKAGVSYPIVLGTSYLDGSPHTDFSTLRLDFVPASCGRTSPGDLHIDLENKAATLSLPSVNNKKNNDSIEFQGKFDPSKDDLDCVCIFNPETQSFTLELINGGQATLRHMPGSKRDKDVVVNKNKIDDTGAGREGRNIIKEKVNSASVPRAPPPTKSAASPKKTRKPAAAVKGSKAKEDIEDEFFHGALD